MKQPITQPCAEETLEGFELSPQQAHLWCHQQEHNANRGVLCLRLPGDTDLERLQRSFALVFQRHEILRTRYRQLPGMTLPVQVIAPQARFNWQTGKALEKTQEDTPSVNWSRLPNNSIRLQLTLPAAHLDSAGLALLANEWATIYLTNPIAANKIQQEPPLQYADYAAWRGELIGSEPRAEAFWAAQLAQVSPLANLPLRRHVQAAPTTVEWAQEDLPLTSLHLQDHAMRLGVEPPHLLLAAWITLLFRHNEAHQLTLGLDWQTRIADLDNALGLFSECLPLTTNQLQQLSFATLCRKLQQQCAELTNWRDYFPSQEAPAAFAAGFRYLPIPRSDSLSDLGWHIDTLHSPTVGCPLLLEYRHRDQSAQLIIHYDGKLFNQAAISLINEQLLTLFEQACHCPDLNLSELSCLSATERTHAEKVLCRLSPLSPEREQQYQRIATLPHLVVCFAEQGRVRENAPAVKSSSGYLSYGDLHRRATALAVCLVERGVRAGAHVGHFLPRDTEAIIAMLAIFKAGAVYVPIDPTYPQSRIDYMLSDSGAELVLTHPTLKTRLPRAWQSPARLLFTHGAQTSDTDLTTPVILLQQAAYLIYTSGSTGQPKGVVITHANALHSLAARIAYYREPVQHFLLLSSLAFDSSIAGLLWTLAQGGCLHIASEAAQKDPAQLARIVTCEGITHLLAVPSFYQLLLQSLGDSHNTLNTVIVAGETCPVALVEAHHSHLPQAHLYNEYGPTEASVWSTVAKCQTPSGDQPITIGRPIPHTIVRLLDTCGNPIARGLKGEIYIGGPGLSPGYYQRPQLTQKAFVQRGDERLYRTGDYAYCNERGELVFLGREDAQVKIRGYRIELGEIERALLRASGAKQAVVLAAAGPDGQHTLRAFVEAEPDIDREQLRSALAALLPDYMIPTELQALLPLPRSANGKIDKKALAALEPHRSQAPFIAPQRQTEIVLASLWEKLLDVEPIGLADDFFALGGHSLLVVRLTHHIKQTFGVEIPVNLVFQYPTLAHLALQVEQRVSPDPLVLLNAGLSERPPLFCLHQPSGDIHHYQTMLAGLSPSQPVYGIALPANRNSENSTLEELAADYCDRICTLQADGPYYLCGWSMGGLLALEITRKLEQIGHQVAFLALIDTTFKPDDEGLPFERLLQRYRDELAVESLPLFTALPRDTFQYLEKHTSTLGKLEQIRYLLLDWTECHGLQLKARPEVVAYTLESMTSARRWLRRYRPPSVKTKLQGWWASETLAADPQLLDDWAALYGGQLQSQTVPGDHDSILGQADFLSQFRQQLEQGQA